MLLKADQRLYDNARAYNLGLIFFTIFLGPLVPPSALPLLYPICFSLIFILVALSIGKNRKYNVVASLVLVALIWVSIIARVRVLHSISRMLQFLFFLYLLAKMVMEIATITRVNMQVIIDSITGYFLLGLAFSTMVMLVATLVPESYNVVHNQSERYEPLKDYFYYAFVTYTTTGYGDIIPLKPISKSLAILIGVSGQLYIAVIIAMLIGKFSNRRTENN